MEQTTAPELRTQELFKDRYIGVVRMGHALSKAKSRPPVMLPQSTFTSPAKVSYKGPIDEALSPFGLERTIVTIVAGFSTAQAIARASDMIASVPERHTGVLRAGMFSFSLPVATPQFTVSLLWHPRLGADQAHRWLRGLVQATCSKVGLCS